MSWYRPTRAGRAARPRRPERAGLCLEALEARELLSASPAVKVVAPPAASGAKAALASAPSTAHILPGVVTGSTLSQTAALRQRLDGLGRNDLRLLAELTATEELIKALNLGAKADQGPLSGPASDAPGSSNAMLNDLLQHLQQAITDNPTAADVGGAAGATGPAAAAGSLPGQAALAGLKDSLAAALADLGIKAPQLGSNSAFTDASLLAQLAPNQGQSGSTSLTPSWWPSGGSLSNFKRGSQVVSSVAGNEDPNKAAPSDKTDSNKADPSKAPAKEEPIEKVGEGMHALICAVEAIACVMTEGADWPECVVAAACLADYVRQIAKMPAPDSDGGGQADHQVSAATFGQHMADVQNQVSCPMDAGHHQVTEADVQKLLTGMIVSVVSKVNPNPEAPPAGAAGAAGPTTPHLPIGGGAVDPIVEGSSGGHGGAPQGPKPVVGPGVPSGPKG